MSYKIEVLNGLPRFYLPLDETSGSTATDLTGNGFTGTYNGSANYANPIVSGLATSRIYGSTGVYASVSNFPQNLWTAGSEEKQFTVEAWVKPRTITAEAHVAGRGQNDGLKIGPNYAVFRVNTSAGILEARWQVARWEGSTHLVGVYSGTSIGLYVNDVLVAATDFSGTFLATDSNFYIGGGSWVSGTDALQVQSVAVYVGVSTKVDVHNRFTLGLLTANYYGTLLSAGAVVYDFVDDSTQIAFEQLLTQETDFNSGTTYSNLTYDSDNGRLSLFDTTTNGVWQGQFDVGELDIIKGSRIDWYSTSPLLTVQTSFDGISWTTATNHAQIPGITSGTDLTNKILYIHVTLSAPGVGQDAPFLDGIHLIIYNTKIISVERPDMSGTIFNADNVTLGEIDDEPIVRNEYSVGAFVKPGYMIIPQVDTSEAVTYYGVSFWMRVDSVNASVANYFFDARKDSNTQAYMGLDNTGAMIYGQMSSVYINGVAKTPTAADFPVGKWVHVTGKLTTPFIGRIFVNAANTADQQGNISFMGFAVLLADFTDSDALRFYKAGISRPYVSYTDDSSIHVVESGYKITKYVWSGN